MRRALLLAAAALFVIWEHIAMARWLGAVGGPAAGLAHAWTALRQDWLLLLTCTDMAVFTALALAWFARDLARRGVPRWRRAGWLGATLVWGCPALLVYLAGKQRAGAPTRMPPTSSES